MKARRAPRLDCSLSAWPTKPLADAPLVELTLNAPAVAAVRHFLDFKYAEPARIAHLAAGSGALCARIAALAHRYECVDPHAEIVAMGLYGDHSEKSCHQALLQTADGMLYRGERIPGPCRFHLRPPSDTGLDPGCIDAVIVSRGHRGDNDPAAVADEICRIAKPGAAVIFIDHDIVSVDDWDIDDRLRPWLLDMREELGRDASSFDAFEARAYHFGPDLYAAYGLMNLGEIVRYLQEGPEGQRLLAEGWHAFGPTTGLLRRHFGKAKRRVRVRQCVTVLGGKVPT